MTKKSSLNNNESQKLPERIAAAVIADIRSGLLKQNERLPSVNEMSKRYQVARDTIEKTYKLLKSEGYVLSVPSKGFFVQHAYLHQKLRVLLLFNKISAYKRIVYDEIVATIGKNGIVDLKVFNYDLGMLNNFVNDELGKYDYYVIMPHFSPKTKHADVLKLLHKIPSNELVILDKDVPEFTDNAIVVYQDFKLDIYQALNCAGNIFTKYGSIKLIFPKFSMHPTEIIDGVALFCKQEQMDFGVESDAKLVTPRLGEVYICITEEDLGIMYKKITCDKSLQLGQNIGIISFNESLLKELLDITVVSTDFAKMGRQVAEMMLTRTRFKLKNPFSMIQRASF